MKWKSSNKFYKFCRASKHITNPVVSSLQIHTKIPKTSNFENVDALVTNLNNITVVQNGYPKHRSNDYRTKFLNRCQFDVIVHDLMSKIAGIEYVIKIMWIGGNFLTTPGLNIFRMVLLLWK